MTAFLSALRKVKKRFSPYRPLIEVFIFKDRIRHNFEQFRKAYPKLAFSPVLKSNAYGHGLVEVAKILDDEQPAFFTVDSLFEARTLRGAGIKSKILVIGYNDPENISYADLRDVSYAITGIEQLRVLAQVLKTKKKMHLKIDTGMHRQGILIEDLQQAIEIIQAARNIELEGVCSHFADSDGQDQQFTKTQIAKWQEVLPLLKKNFSSIKYLHLANTAGIFYSKIFECNVARLGAGLYGVNRSPFENFELQPALEMQSIISSVKTIKAGEFVGYNLTYQADREIKVATVPAGYFEGVDRRLSNKGFFEVAGLPCPILGRVSMNITTIDVSGIKDVKMGDPVTIVSAAPQAKNSVENIAEQAGTIGREILVHIPQHLRRTVI